ncbi:MAG: hypothetical protein AAF304_10230 [Pseudomonadota bacterium]
MAVLSEKVLWPVLAVFIFGIMAGFYIDDRRKMMQESGSASKEHAGKSADQQHAKNEHAGNAAEEEHSTKEHGGNAADAKQKVNEHAGKSASTSSSSNASTSMSLKDYLAQSSHERSQQLEANVTHHQGFSGSIDEYLTGSSPTPKSNQQTKMVVQNTNTQNHGATSMSMDEYQTQASGQAIAHNNSHEAYHGDIDGYLTKFGGDQQTPINKESSEPFNTKEHMGFHGSYEEYAKKYN